MDILRHNFENVVETVKEEAKKISGLKNAKNRLNNSIRIIFAFLKDVQSFQSLILNDDLLKSYIKKCCEVVIPIPKDE